MTRKNFIKRLGGYGITRNTANGMAEITRQRGGTYEHAWAYFQLLHTEITRRVKKAVWDALRHGKGTVTMPDMDDFLPYSPTFDFEIKSLSEPTPWWYYTFGAMPLHPPVVKLRTKVNLHLHTHTNAPCTDPVTVRVGTAGGGGHE